MKEKIKQILKTFRDILSEDIVLLSPTTIEQHMRSAGVWEDFKTYLIESEKHRCRNIIDICVDRELLFNKMKTYLKTLEVHDSLYDGEGNEKP
jgi:hypothetical protein